MFGLTSKPLQNASSQPFGVTPHSMGIAESAESFIQFVALLRSRGTYVTLTLGRPDSSIRATGDLQCEGFPGGSWCGDGLQRQWKALEREDGFEPPSPGR